MLEFIVLGIVPGTNFVITFNGVLIIAASLLIITELVLRVRMSRQQVSVGLSIEDMAL